MCQQSLSAIRFVTISNILLMIKEIESLGEFYGDFCGAFEYRNNTYRNSYMSLVLWNG